VNGIDEENGDSYVLRVESREIVMIILLPLRLYFYSWGHHSGI
jgi:hypothetical protein